MQALRSAVQEQPAGAVHAHGTGGYSGGCNGLRNSGGFCSATAVCQHLPRGFSLGRPQLGRNARP